MTDQEICGACDGSRRMPRDPDIGTDQECFVCDGSGVIAAHEAKAAPAVPQGEPVAWQARFLGQEWAPCTKEHHDWVRREPKEFVGYEVRALCLCATPAAPSQPVTLTEEEIKRNWSGGACPPWGIKFARAIIATLREKEQAT